MLLQAPSALQNLPVKAERLPANTAVPVSALFVALSIWALSQVLLCAAQCSPDCFLCYKLLCDPFLPYS